MSGSYRVTATLGLVIHAAGNKPSHFLSYVPNTLFVSRDSQINRLYYTQSCQEYFLSKIIQVNNGVNTVNGVRRCYIVFIAASPVWKDEKRKHGDIEVFVSV